MGREMSEHKVISIERNGHTPPRFSMYGPVVIMDQVKDSPLGLESCDLKKSLTIPFPSKCTVRYFGSNLPNYGWNRVEIHWCLTSYFGETNLATVIQTTPDEVLHLRDAVCLFEHLNNKVDLLLLAHRERVRVHKDSITPFQCGGDGF